MFRQVIIILFLFSMIAAPRLHAQCVDSSLISNAYCDPHWDPVCACNGKTYQNDCFVRNAGISTQNFVYGICDPVDFVFNPNPSYDYIDIDAMLKVQGDMYVQLFDRFGKIWYSTIYTGVTRFQFQISVKGLPAGVYFINIFCDGGYRVKKLVVPGIY